MNKDIIVGLLIPLLGTTLGAALVYIVKENLSERVSKMFTGFAGGVMVAASFWSLLVPSIEMSQSAITVFPAAFGFLLGIGFLLCLDTFIPHMHIDKSEEGVQSKLSSTTKMVLAVTLHNIPEGMAVGVIFAGFIAKSAAISMLGAFALAIGIAIQNFPEGAIVSMMLITEGVNKHKAFLYGFLSGLVEPIAAFITILFASFVTNILSYFLSFAAGAMIYVVVEELVPDMAKGKHSNLGTIAFALGFVTMMILDVTLG